MKKVTLKQVGYEIGGESLINLWGGGQGTIEMDSSTIPLGKMTKDNLLRCVNDGSFGCESIENANLIICDLFENGYTEYNRTIFVKGTKQRNALFGRGI